MTAYDQGYFDGYDGNSYKNPYAPETHEHEDYDRGYDQGDIDAEKDVEDEDPWYEQEDGWDDEEDEEDDYVDEEDDYVDDFE